MREIQKADVDWEGKNTIMTTQSRLQNLWRLCTPAVRPISLAPSMHCLPRRANYLKSVHQENASWPARPPIARSSSWR
jgi:hypothetical protein